MSSGILTREGMKRRHVQRASTVSVFEEPKPERTMLSEGRRKESKFVKNVTIFAIYGTGPKSGTTTYALDLAASISSFGHDVLIVDTHPNLGMSKTLRLEDTPLTEFYTSYMPAGNRSLSESMNDATGYSGFQYPSVIECIDVSDRFVGEPRDGKVWLAPGPTIEDDAKSRDYMTLKDETADLHELDYFLALQYYAIVATAREKGCANVVVDMSPAADAFNQYLIMWCASVIIAPMRFDADKQIMVPSYADCLLKWSGAKLRQVKKYPFLLATDGDIQLPLYNVKFMGVVGTQYVGRGLTYLQYDAYPLRGYELLCNGLRVLMENLEKESMAFPMVKYRQNGISPLLALMPQLMNVFPVAMGAGVPTRHAPLRLLTPSAKTHLIELKKHMHCHFTILFVIAKKYILEESARIEKLFEKTR